MRPVANGLDGQAEGQQHGADVQGHLVASPSSASVGIITRAHTSAPSENMLSKNAVLTCQ
jgi:hypothetical protein